MLMATLLLRLAAPMQAWGMDAKFETRLTMREPTKSGVIGMLAAALGCRRDELPEPLTRLRMAVRVDQEGRLLEDFHAVHGIAADDMGRIVWKADGTPQAADKRDFITYRQYLCDAVFLVALESDDASYLNALADALRCPAFPLFLGRRSCPPTLPLVLGVMESGADDVLARYPWQASERYQRSHRQAALRVIADARPGSGARPSRRDVPVSFDPRRRLYGMRAVTQAFVYLPRETEHDPMSELE